MRTAAEDDGHAVEHRLVEVAETEARLLLSAKVGRQVEAFAERVDYYIFLLNKIVCGPNIERLSLMLKKWRFQQKKRQRSWNIKNTSFYENYI